MKFLRFAQIELSKPLADSWRKGMTVDATSVNGQRLDREDGRNLLLVYAEVPMTGTPALTGDRKIEIEESIVRESERAIETFANVVAVATGSAREIRSPVPCAGLSDIGDQDRVWLKGCTGLSMPDPSSWRANITIPLVGGELAAVDDRVDGIELLAEALGNSNEVGKFRELARFFELAFAQSSTKLDADLATFLAYFDKLQYSVSETLVWRDLRDRSSHADRRSPALVRDVQPVLARVEFAAYDVLFNKTNWHASDTARRDVWSPPGGVLEDGKSMVAVSGDSLSLQPIPLDGFGSYVHDLKCRLDLNRFPGSWWVDESHRWSRSVTVDTVISLKS